MMHEKITEQIKEAMRAKDQLRLLTLRSVLAAFTNESVALKRTPQDRLSDDEAIAVIRRLVKQRKDSIEQFEKAGRQELADNEKLEMKILEEFLPAQMSEEKVREIAKSKIDALRQAQGDNNTLLDKGKLIGIVIKECAGQADGAVVKRVVEELLS